MKTKKGSDHIKKSRKTLRKEKRQNKKARKNDFYVTRNKPGKFVLQPTADDSNEADRPPKGKKRKNEASINVEKPLNQTTNGIMKEKNEMQKLQRQMNKQRKKQMIQANVMEDKNIKRLEKQLKLNKRKSKSVPKSFATDGLDYLLEVCDSENLKDIVNAEMGFSNVNDGFEEDFALMTGKTSKKIAKKDEKHSESKRIELNEDDSNYESDSEINEEISALEEGQEEVEEENSENSDSVNEMKDLNSDNEFSDNKAETSLSEDEFDESDAENSDFEEETSDLEEKSNLEEKSDFGAKKSDSGAKKSDFPAKKSTLNNKNSNTDEKMEKDTWEDIYGRLRDKKGNVITSKENTAKYIPPAARAQSQSNANEKLTRLKRQIKGLLNRLAESNMHSISNQLESLYMANSRNDMNETLTNLILESVISSVITPERLLLEHVLLITILHANVGSEVGAHFLQSCVTCFNDTIRRQDSHDGQVEDKTLDNVVNVVAQLYNFKIFGSNLLYDILSELAAKFEEKHVECILNVLRSVGFTLRKDDPGVLKSLIGSLQRQASEKSSSDNPRVKFMLEILLAIKNNNVNKIPNYDTSYSEHLKKISKSFIRKGNYVTSLNVGLEDLLKADERGKWWVVGSAWTGKDTKFGSKSEQDEVQADVDTGNQFSQKLLDLARKQRMNTDTRRNIFCILMSAEDYMDAFEKLLKLSLKNQQEREIINVILHCVLREKKYNPYYSVLAQKFCDYDRKFQMIIKYSIWDKVKALGECSPSQIANLAKLLTHLFLEKGLPITTLKIVEFSELDKVTLRFLRQILLGILLCKSEDQCVEVFEKVAHKEPLKMFRESLRLFVHHFLLRNLKLSEDMDEKSKQLLGERVKVVDKLLVKSKQESF